MQKATLGMIDAYLRGRRWASLLAVILLLIGATWLWPRLGRADEVGRAAAEGESPASAVASRSAWDVEFARRLDWWSFQPIDDPDVPEIAERPVAGLQVDGGASRRHPIDRFIARRQEAKGLVASPPAAAETVVRRLYFSLIGLPPTVEATALWSQRIADDRAAGIEALCDELLASPHFGERWGRHWLDWVRYAESHGSEGDPALAEAWRYRDYVIRALNDDVPYDQLVREYVAGDLLPNPRINQDLGVVESIIGTAHWRMVFHGFSPTDALDEKVRFVDDQVNTFSKAMLGLTVSCARCHDHKFDPISQRDYYALFGVLACCQPGRAVIDLPERLNVHQTALQQLKTEVREELAAAWLAGLESHVEKYISRVRNEPEAKHGSLAEPILRFLSTVDSGDDFSTTWRAFAREWETRQTSQESAERDGVVRSWRLGNQQEMAGWYLRSPMHDGSVCSAGQFTLHPEGDEVLHGIYPRGIYSHGLSTKQPLRCDTDDVLLPDDCELWIRAIGGGNASLRYVVHDFPRNGTIYPHTRLAPSWKWYRYDVDYWTGDALHVELATARDAPLLVANEERSWFGVRDVVLRKRGGEALADVSEELAPIVREASAAAPRRWDDVSARYRSAILLAIRAWRQGEVDSQQALLLDACVRQGILPNGLDMSPKMTALVGRYRELEQQIPVPRRVPALDETRGTDHPLFTRGDHRLPGDLVPRRFLSAVDKTPYGEASSGRLKLADDLLRDDNPLTTRVIVNRVWHHLFGVGIVRTPDNFGVLGEKPSHPELLDWLACRFRDDGWSIKKLIRLMVTSQTWQASATPQREGLLADPENRLLTHANVRRVEAEAVRDTLLMLSGKLDRTRGGESVGFDSPRRTIYLRVRRNALFSFLRTFDFPEPFATVGRREVTNVPAQSLTFLNDPFVDKCAQEWAERIVADEELHDREGRVRRMLEEGLQRRATDEEMVALVGFVVASEQGAGETDSSHGYHELAKAIFAFQEFVYVE